MPLQNWSCVAEVTVRDAGNLYAFGSLEEAVRHFRRTLRPALNEPHFDPGLVEIPRSSYWSSLVSPVVFRDELGLPIPLWRLRLARDGIIDPSRIGRFRFRQGPVPGTGAGHRYGGYLRYVQTAQQIRASSAIDEGEIVVRWRPERRAAHMRTAYDDVVRGRQRSWKAHRTHQWKD